MVRERERERCALARGGLGTDLPQFSPPGREREREREGETCKTSRCVLSGCSLAVVWHSFCIGFHLEIPGAGPWARGAYGREAAEETKDRDGSHENLPFKSAQKIEKKNAFMQQSSMCV